MATSLTHDWPPLNTVGKIRDYREMGNVPLKSVFLCIVLIIHYKKLLYALTLWEAPAASVALCIQVEKISAGFKLINIFCISVLVT